jgi:hypothetical protein
MVETIESFQREFLTFKLVLEYFIKSLTITRLTVFYIAAYIT